MKLRSIRNGFLMAGMACLSLGMTSLFAQETSGNGTAKLEDKAAIVAQGARDLASQNVAMGAIRAETAGKSQAVKNLCQADLVHASFSPKFRLRDAIVGLPTPQGCLTCGNRTYCPQFGECIDTGCGVICNPQD